MNFVNRPLALRDMQDKKAVYHGRTKGNLREIQNPYGARYGTAPVPKYHIASKVHLVSTSTRFSSITFAREFPQMQLIRSSMMSSPWVHILSLEPAHFSDAIADGSPVLNLASFVNTWMPPQADKLMYENMSKNLIGKYYSRNPIFIFFVLTI